MVSSFSHTDTRLEENQPGAICVAVKFCAVIKQLDRGFTDSGGPEKYCGHNMCRPGRYRGIEGIIKYTGSAKNPHIPKFLLDRFILEIKS